MQFWMRRWMRLHGNNKECKAPGVMPGAKGGNALDKDTIRDFIKEYCPEELKEHGSPRYTINQAIEDIAHKIQEGILEEHEGRVASLRSKMNECRKETKELRDEINYIKNNDYKSEAMQHFHEAVDYVKNLGNDFEKIIQKDVFSKINSTRNDILESIDKRVQQIANSQNPYLDEVEGFLCLMEKHKCTNEIIQEALPEFINALSYLYWRRIKETTNEPIPEPRRRKIV